MEANEKKFVYLVFHQKGSAAPTSYTIYSTKEAAVEKAEAEANRYPFDARHGKNANHHICIRKITLDDPNSKSEFIRLQRDIDSQQRRIAFQNGLRKKIEKNPDNEIDGNDDDTSDDE